MGGRFWGTVNVDRPAIVDLKKFVKPDDFNDIYVKCVGRRVTVKVNELTTLDEALAAAGEEGFFLWSIAEPGTELTVRNIRFKELPPTDAGWVQLLNGKDLQDWRVVGEPTSSWQIRDGLLWGSGGRTYLVSRRKFPDFHLRAECRINPGGHAGIFYRSDPTDAQLRAGSFRPFGFEVEQTRLDNGGGNNLVVGLSRNWERQGAQTHGRPFKADEWLTLDLLVQGDRFHAKPGSSAFPDLRLPTLTQTDAERQSQPGPIILHLHTNTSLFEFRKIEIKELPPA